MISYIKINQVHKMEIIKTIATEVLSLIVKHLNVKTNYLILVKIFKYFLLYQFLLNRRETLNIFLLFNKIINSKITVNIFDFNNGCN